MTVNLAQNKRNVINGTITTEILGYTVKENVSVQADEDDEYSYHTKITIPKVSTIQFFITSCHFAITLICVIVNLLLVLNHVACLRVILFMVIILFI